MKTHLLYKYLMLLEYIAEEVEKSREKNLWNQISC